MKEIIHHLAGFISRLWQIHIFGEGNTRTTAVFFIKYLRTLGFSANNDIFAENAWYFRNALVRANYTNLQKGIHETTEYLETFLRNLLLGEDTPLRNRTLHVSGILKSEKPDIRDEKPDIESDKSDIRHKKPDIEMGFSARTAQNVYSLQAEVGYDTVFGRTEVMYILGIKTSAASGFLSKLLKAGIIEAVAGHGKGKYRFKR